MSISHEPSAESHGRIRACCCETLHEHWVMELDLECSVCAEPFDCKTRTPMVLPCSGSHEICALCVVALRDRFGGDDGAFHCPSCREPILPCFPINKNRGLMAALRLNERLARRRR